MKTYLCFSTFHLASLCTSSLLSSICWPRSLSLSLFFLSSICPPFHALSPLFFTSPPLSCAPFFSLLHLLAPSLSTQSSIYSLSLLSEHYGAVRVNGVPVNSTGQVLNPPPPALDPIDTQLFNHPALWGGGVSWCQSSLVWRDHHASRADELIGWFINFWDFSPK